MFVTAVSLEVSHYDPCQNECIYLYQWFHVMRASELVGRETFAPVGGCISHEGGLCFARKQV